MSIETFLSLSKSATLVCWYAAVFAAVGFGTLFLVSWLAEEFAQSDKWKRRRTFLLIMAIIGCAGEQLATVAEFAFSEHLQTISDKDLAKLRLDTQQLATDEAKAKEETEQARREEKKDQLAILLAQRQVEVQREQTARMGILLEDEKAHTSWRSLDSRRFVDCLKKAPNGLTVSVWYKGEDTEAAMFAWDIWNAVKGAPGWNVATLQAFPSKGEGNSALPENAPPDIRNNTFQELEVRCRTLPSPKDPKYPAYAALMDAVGGSQMGNGRPRNGSLVSGADPSLPDGNCLIIVGQEQ